MSKILSDEALDRASRDRYRDAVQHVSFRTRSQLAASRHAAMRGDPAQRRGWPLGAALGGCAAIVFAITLGLNFNQALDPDAGAPARMETASAAAGTVPSVLPIVTALDEDPDFYAWLASSDAQLMAME